jgi:hypothetical protein
VTRGALKKFIGKMCLLRWRDPSGEPGWTAAPLKSETTAAETLCWLRGFNGRGEVITVSTQSADGEVSDRNAIPVALVESVEELGPQSRRRRR